MKDLRIMYMGTPSFSATILEGLIKESYNVVALVSQPDRPLGRKKIITPTPTKVIALEHNIPVYQVEKIRTDYEFIKEINPDIIITCAYGQIIPQAVLDIPKYGCINIHASLLPRLRGGAPIHHALIDGEDKTGITIMEMAAGMDNGDIYLQKETKILDTDDLESLSNRLQEMGKDLIIEFLPKYLNNELHKIKQDESKVTFGYNITKEEENIDWNKEARKVFNQIRGISPIPGAHTFLDGELFKIYKTEINEESSNKEAGTIVISNKDIIVYCGKGSLKLLTVQPFSKKKMEVKEYLNGKPVLDNKKFSRG